MGDLTTAANVKTYLGITGTSDDALIARIVSAVSARIESHCGRTLTTATYTSEYYDSIGDTRIVPKNVPVTTLTTVVENGTTLSASDYASDGYTITRLSNGAVVAWASGERVIALTYTAGLGTAAGGTLPADLVELATAQAANEFQRTKPGGARLGIASSQVGPGTSGYIVGEWVPGALAVLSAYRRLA